MNRVCRNCGASIIQDAGFCHKCGGHLLVEYNTTLTPPTTNTAAVISFISGLSAIILTVITIVMFSNNTIDNYEHWYIVPIFAIATAIVGVILGHIHKGDSPLALAGFIMSVIVLVVVVVFIAICMVMSKSNNNNNRRRY